MFGASLPNIPGLVTATDQCALLGSTIQGSRTPDATLLATVIRFAQSPADIHTIEACNFKRSRSR
jgi:hypothetical protein